MRLRTFQRILAARAVDIESLGEDITSVMWCGKKKIATRTFRFRIDLSEEHCGWYQPMCPVIIRVIHGLPDSVYYISRKLTHQKSRREDLRLLALKWKRLVLVLAPLAHHHSQGTGSDDFLV